MIIDRQSLDIFYGACPTCHVRYATRAQSSGIAVCENCCSHVVIPRRESAVLYQIARLEVLLQRIAPPTAAAG